MTSLRRSAALLFSLFVYSLSALVLLWPSVVDAAEGGPAAAVAAALLSLALIVLPLTSPYAALFAIFSGSSLLWLSGGKLGNNSSLPPPGLMLFVLWLATGFLCGASIALAGLLLPPQAAILRLPLSSLARLLAWRPSLLLPPSVLSACMIFAIPAAVFAELTILPAALVLLVVEKCLGATHDSWSPEREIDGIDESVCAVPPSTPLPKKRRHAVVLVHGLGADQSEFVSARWFLPLFAPHVFSSAFGGSRAKGAGGASIHSLNLHTLSRCGLIPDAVDGDTVRGYASTLAVFLKSKFSDDDEGGGVVTHVTLVGHSMGGLVASYVAECLFQSALPSSVVVTSVISVCSPFRGSCTLALLRRVGLAWLLGQNTSIFRDLLPTAASGGSGSAAAAAAAATETTTVTGDSSPASSLLAPTSRKDGGGAEAVLDELVRRMPPPGEGGRTIVYRHLGGGLDHAVSAMSATRGTVGNCGCGPRAPADERSVCLLPFAGHTAIVAQGAAWVVVAGWLAEDHQASLRVSAEEGGGQGAAGGDAQRTKRA